MCERHAGVADYPRFKKWCDDYFYPPIVASSGEVGGIFFDHLEGEPYCDRSNCPRRGRRQCWMRISRSPAAGWTSRLEPAERAFQEYRRGRYVEFNLLYYRGTLFGLKTAWRVESSLCRCRQWSAGATIIARSLGPRARRNCTISCSHANGLMWRAQDRIAVWTQTVLMR